LKHRDLVLDTKLRNFSQTSEVKFYLKLKNTKNVFTFFKIAVKIFAVSPKSLTFAENTGQQPLCSITQQQKNMADFNYSKNYGNYSTVDVVAAQNTLLRKVYLWMTAALAITGFTAFTVANNPALLQMIFGSRFVFYGLLIGELVLVVWLSAAIQRLSIVTATLMFVLYSVLNGATMSVIFLAYTASSIATTFFITAGTFGSMALVGSITKTDLSRFGNILLMALIGLIVATVVNLFLKNSMMDMIISGIGVLIFTGLTAYDAQKIKALTTGMEDNDETQKLAVLGALSLYLDFINLFLYLLRFFGRRSE